MGICGSSSKNQAIAPGKISIDFPNKSIINEDNQEEAPKTDQRLFFHPKNTQNASTINENEDSTDQNPRKKNLLTHEEAFRRRGKAHNTVMLNINEKKHLKKALITNNKNNKENIDTTLDNSNNPLKFHRRNKKSTTLIEKSKLGDQIFKEELKLCVNTQTIVGESGGDPTKKYNILSKLGDGSFGTVFLAINSLTKSKVAMKKIIKVKENVIDNLEIKNEIDILKKLDHPNIVKIFEFYETNDSYYIVTEYCKKGELYGYIKNQYTEQQLAVLFYQVFSGLCYLHDNHILHRDLKLENILISEIEKDLKSKQNFFWIKIIDFGTAKIFKKNKSEKAVVGSSYYIAPEVLKHKYDEKCDTWSVGVILYMLIVGRAPFDGDDDDEIIEKIKKGTYNTNNKKLLACSKEVQDLVKRLLDINAETRLSSREALNHPWFANYGGRSLYSNFDKKEMLLYIDNLFNYKFQSKFQQLVLAFVVHNIPHSAETKLILKLFRFLNIKGDCKLTKPELLNGLCYFKQKEEILQYLEDIFLSLDGDNNGYIEYEEFLRACMDKKQILTDNNLHYAFNFLDKDKTKTLSVNKIMNAFVTKGNKTLEEIFKNTIKEVDRNNDGEINFEEFKELMLNVS